MKGIRRHGAGWQTEVRVVGHPRSVESWPLDTRTDVMVAWRKDEAARLRLTSPRATKGTFAADARNYLRATNAHKERIRQIDLWIAEFRTRPRASIQPWEILAVANRWLTEGPKRVWRTWKTDGIERRGGRLVDVPEPLSASQVNKRLRALENLWTLLDGRHSYNPVREVPEPEEPEGLARGIPYAVVEALLAQMPDRGRPIKGQARGPASLTKLRLRAIAYTGLSHSELAGIGSSDLHLEPSLPWAWVAGRRKGKGTKGTAQPLTAEGAAALRALAEAGGLGPFSPSAMWKSFQRACVKIGLPGATPYDLRHSFASEVLEHTDGNLSVTQLLMRHKSPKTTLRYAQKAIDPVRAAAIEKIRQSGGFQ